jgi:hypothetical protein
MKMRTTKTLLIAAVVAVAVLAAGLTPIYAQPEADTPNTEPFFNRAQQLERLRETLRNRLQIRQSNGEASPPAEIDVDDLDEAEIDSIIGSVESAEATDESLGPIWLVHTRGFSWSTDATEDSEGRTPIGMYLAVRKVKTTETGTLYEVIRGTVGHEGERVKVEGKAVLRDDGVFALKLSGEDLELKAVGRVARARVGVRVAMKGRLVHDGEDYSFKMTGRAIPIRPMWAWRRSNPAQDEEQPEPSVTQNRLAKGSTA